MIHEIAPKKYDVHYRPLQPADGDRYIGFNDGNVIVKDAEDVILPTIGEAKAELHVPADAEFTYLFAIDGERYFGTRDFFPELQPGYVFPFGHSFLLREPRDRAFAALLGHHILGWYERSRFCGRCGSKTRHSETEREMVCDVCGNMIYPQICPSVIVGVLHDDRLLVTHYNPEHLMINNGRTSRPTKHLSLVAGYIEYGETAEQAVEREVMEEVGLRVKNIRPYKTAPWPLSGSLLLGYFCEADGDPTPNIDGEELADAFWARREDLPDRSRFQALTNDMIEAFRTGRI